ncbi:MAG: hypothetical protein ACN6I6_02210 [bacterium]
MKIHKFLIFIFLGNFSLAFASCFEHLCTDDTVRDIYGWKGSVVEFQPLNRTANVWLHHNGYIFTFPIDELGKQVSCAENFCQGDRVKNAYGDTLIIEEVYTHQMLYTYNLNTDGYALYTFAELETVQTP